MRTFAAFLLLAFISNAAFSQTNPAPPERSSAQAATPTTKTASTAPAFAFEDGVIANNTYANECFGISLPVPAGWKISTEVLSGDGKAYHISPDALILLRLERIGEGPRDRIALQAFDSSRWAPAADDFVANRVEKQVERNPDHRKLLNGTHSVEYSGHEFFRGDYEIDQPQSTAFQTVAYTAFRGYYIGIEAIAGSLRELEDADAVLQQLSFKANRADPNCSMRGEHPPKSAIGASAANNAGVASASNSSGTAGAGTATSKAQRIRISKGVATAMLIKRVEPQYPEVARFAHTKGKVTVRLLIDENGDVTEATPVSGDALLTPAAVDAAKQWKFKPFLLNSEPVPVEVDMEIKVEPSK